MGVQHRHPEAAGRLFLDEARALLTLCRPAGVPLFVNGRLDVALLLGTHLHLPAHGLCVADCRPYMSGSWISVAVHSPEEAAGAQGADLALLSPVFPAGSKPHDTRTPLGPDGFSRLADCLRDPAAYALGGITSQTAPQLPRAAGFAVQSGVLDAPDPRAAAEALLRSRGHV